MKLRIGMQHLGAFSALALALPVAFTAPAFAEKANASLFSKAQSVTAASPDKVVSATVWLNLHDRAAFDSSVAKMYQKGSPTYHQWLKSGDLARFAPTSADMAAVTAELKGQGLSIDSVGSHNMFVRVSGPVSKMQTAFHTQIMSLNIKGEVVRATTSQPKLAGPAAAMVANVSGLTQNKMSPHSVRATDPATGKNYPGVPVADFAASPNGAFFEASCFVTSGVIEHFKSPGVTAKYSGNGYGAPITNTTYGTLAPCGYSPADLTRAYRITNAYDKGLDGTGQTIVIVDAYGSPTIWDDANLFSEIYGLPALTSSNFQVVEPLGPPSGSDSGWATETTLDVEWAHAIAPGANIVLLVSPSAFDNDLMPTLSYGIVNQLGSVISNSYGSYEAGSDPAALDAWSTEIELGASLGQSVNFSTGDYGDLEQRIGVKTVSVPSDSPYATAVGGTSLAINPNGKFGFQTGWGNNVTALALYDGTVLDPPINLGFQYGAGGGESTYFSKPSWQSSLPGVGRQQPDISWDADPSTGVELIITEGDGQVVFPEGGTSLACPAFSAIWAIANQKAGEVTGQGTLLGQAAPIVASLAGTDAITDVTAYTSPHNVSGKITDSEGTTLYTADELAAPLENTTSYYSAIYNSPYDGNWYDITFGTDSSLVVGPGWDNVTGFGTPNGYLFIKAAAGVTP